MCVSHYELSMYHWIRERRQGGTPVLVLLHGLAAWSVTHRTGPPPMRALTSIRRGPLLVYLASTWNTPMWKPSA